MHIEFFWLSLSFISYQWANMQWYKHFFYCIVSFLKLTILAHRFPIVFLLTWAISVSKYLKWNLGYAEAHKKFSLKLQWQFSYFSHLTYGLLVMVKSIQVFILIFTKCPSGLEKGVVFYQECAYNAEYQCNNFGRLQA